ncbi:Zn(2)-C6 fungal-type DNA-binding domain [Phaffia rhodozyma]|uniref:Zn(2)-C6 fungal-type DNA-binding domain n=1 Tax=Phaffia rhodozyma TaxID=264483 RepID=A0A0F7SSQ9_PHARH|nr:Zn(2)-C6 fungal-type DNA-binding domain [Phaffia rhodozyma]
MCPSFREPPVSSVRSSEGDDIRSVRLSSVPPLTRSTSPPDQSSPTYVGQDQQLLAEEVSSSVVTPVQSAVSRPSYGRMSLKFLTQTQSQPLDSDLLSNQPLPIYGQADPQSQSPSLPQSQEESNFFQHSFRPSVHQSSSVSSAKVSGKDLKDPVRNIAQDDLDKLPRGGPSSSGIQYTNEYGDEDDDKEETSSKKRRRVETACNGCRKRRSKCGGGLPCNSCFTNNTECVYPPPAKKLTLKHFEELERRIVELQSLNNAYEGRTIAPGTGVSPAESTRFDTTQSQQRQTASSLYEFYQSDLFSSISGGHPDARLTQENGRLYPQPLPQPALPFQSDLPVGLSPDGFQRRPSPVKGPFLGLSSQGSLMSSETTVAGLMVGDLSRQPNVRRWSVATDNDIGKGKEARTSMNEGVGKTHEVDIFDASDAVNNMETDNAVETYKTEEGPEGAKNGCGDVPIDESARRPRWERIGQFGYNTDVVEDAAAKLHGNDQNRSTEMVPDAFVMRAMEPPSSGNKLFCLPPLAEAEDLLKYYHERIHYLLPVFDFVDLHDRYLEATLWPKLKPRTAIDLVFQASLNLIFSIVAVLSTHHGECRNDSISSVVVLCSKGLLAVNAVGLAIFMSRNIQLDKSDVNSKINIRDRCIRQRLWAACMQMEATTSAMLYRQTTLKEHDFAADSMILIDDDDLYPSTQRSIDKPKDILFFYESTKLFSIKIKVLQRLYAFKDTIVLPNTSALVELEVELHEWWKKVPSHLKERTQDSVLDASNTRLQMQSHNLISRYCNALVLLYRPFLFFFCSAPRNTAASQTNIRNDIARKSAALCAEAAISLINEISRTWDGAQLGFWWCLLGYVYNSALIILAHRIVNQVHPASISDSAERESTEAVRQGLSFLQSVGADREDGFKFGTHWSTPPKSARSTARRCFKILVNIQQAVRAPPREKEAIEAVFRESGEQELEPECQIQGPDPGMPYVLEKDSSAPVAPGNGEFLSDWLENADSNFLDEDTSTPFRPYEYNPNPDLAYQTSWQDWTSLLETVSRLCTSAILRFEAF